MKSEVGPSYRDGTPAPSLFRRPRVSRPRRDTIALTIPKHTIWIGLGIAAGSVFAVFAIGVWFGGRTAEVPAPVATTRVVLQKPIEALPVEPPPDEPPPPSPPPEAPKAPVKIDLRDRPPSGKYGIQIGAFPDRTEANEFLEKWAASLEGLPVHVLPAKVGSKGVWHRVRVGSFADDEAAQVSLRAMPEDLAKGSLVVRYQ
jgi:hypothetical protein